VHADDSFGRDGLEGANKGFAKAGLKGSWRCRKPIATSPTMRSGAALWPARPRPSLWIGSAKAVADGVRALRAAKSAAHVVTLSNNASAGFIKSAGRPFGAGV
jgi:hypothetical protein